MVPTAAERSNVLVRWTARSWSAAACTCDSAAAVRGPEIRFLGPFSRVSVLDTITTNKHVVDHRTSKRIAFRKANGYDRGGGRPCVRGTDRTQHVRGGRWTGARALADGHAGGSRSIIGRGVGQPRSARSSAGLRVSAMKSVVISAVLGATAVPARARRAPDPYRQVFVLREVYR